MSIVQAVSYLFSGFLKAPLLNESATTLVRVIIDRALKKRKPGVGIGAMNGLCKRSGYIWGPANNQGGCSMDFGAGSER